MSVCSKRYFVTPPEAYYTTKESVGRKFILKGGSDKAATLNKQYPTPYDWVRGDRANNQLSDGRMLFPCVFETVRFPFKDKSFTLSSNMYVARGQHRRYRNYLPYCAGYCDNFHTIASRPFPCPARQSV